MAGTVPLPQLMKALETAPPNSLIEHVHVTQFEKKNHLIEFIVTVEPFAHRGTHYTIGKRYEEFDQLKSHCSSIATFKSKFPTLKSFGAPSTKDLHARCHALDLWLRECLELSTSFPIVQRALFKFLEVHVNVDLGLGAGAAPTGGVPTSVRRASVGGAARRRSQQHKTLDFSALALGAAGGDVEADILSPSSGAGVPSFPAASAPPAPPAVPVGPSVTRQKIDAIYQQYNPAKLSEVDVLVGRYGEEQLLAMVTEKYVAPSVPPKPQVTMKAAGAAVMAATAVQQVGGPGASAPPMMSAVGVEQVGGPAGSHMERRTSKGQVALAAGLTAFQDAYETPPAIQELPAAAVAPPMMSASAVQQVGGPGPGAGAPAMMSAGAVQQMGGPGAGGPSVMAAGAVQQMGGPGSGGPSVMAAGAVQQVGGPGAGAPSMMAAGAVQQVGGPGAGAPSMMAAGAVQEIGGSPQTQDITITVPQNARGGNTLKLKLSTGQDVQIKLPDNARPGQTLKIRVPVPSAPAPAPAAMMTPEMKLAAELGVPVEQAAQMLREDAEAKARATQRRASVTLQASAPQPVRPGMRDHRTESMMLAQEIGVDRVTARHMLDENKQASQQISADAQIEEEVTITVPAGARPGQTLKCKVSDGMVVSIKVPANAAPGSKLRLRVPSPKRDVSMRAAGAAVMAAGAVQQVGGPGAGAGAPRMMAAGAVQQVGGPGAGAGAPGMMAAGAVQQVGGPGAGAGAPRMMAAGAVQQVGGPGAGAGAPRMMAVGAGAVQQLPPSPQAIPQPVKAKMQITVPHGVKPGAPLQVQLPDGRTARIKVPAGARPGSTLTIQV